MFKKVAKLIAIAFVIFVIAYFIINNRTYANMKLKNEGITNWQIAITSDAKDLNDTRKMIFKVQDEPNVAKGKIAPGTKATAKIEIDLRETTSPVTIMADVDKANISSQLNLTAKIDNEEYEIGTEKYIKPENRSGFTSEDGIKNLELELEWDYSGNNDKIDTEMGIMNGTISIPVTILVDSKI